MWYSMKASASATATSMAACSAMGTPPTPRRRLASRSPEFSTVPYIAPPLRRRERLRLNTHKMCFSRAFIWRSVATRRVEVAFEMFEYAHGATTLARHKRTRDPRQRRDPRPSVSREAAAFIEEGAARHRSPPPSARTCSVRRPGEKATTRLIFPFVGTRDALARSRDGRRVPH